MSSNEKELGDVDLGGSTLLGFAALPIEAACRRPFFRISVELEKRSVDANQFLLLRGFRSFFLDLFFAFPLQVQYSLLDRRPDNGLIEFCQKHDISLLPYGTVGGGFLTDK